MDHWSSAKSIPWLGEAVVGTVAAALSLVAVAWMAAASPANDEPVASSPSPARAAAVVAANAPGAAYVLFVVGDEGAAAKLRGVLLTEAHLRALAAEAPRRAGVVVVRDAATFDTLAASTNDDGAFSTQLAVQLIDLRPAASR